MTPPQRGNMKEFKLLSYAAYLVFTGIERGKESYRNYLSKIGKARYHKKDYDEMKDVTYQADLKNIPTDLKLSSYSDFVAKRFVKENPEIPMPKTKRGKAAMKRVENLYGFYALLAEVRQSSSIFLNYGGDRVYKEVLGVIGLLLDKGYTTYKIGQAYNNMAELNDNFQTEYAYYDASDIDEKEQWLNRFIEAVTGSSYIELPNELQNGEYVHKTEKFFNTQGFKRLSIRCNYDYSSIEDMFL